MGYLRLNCETTRRNATSEYMTGSQLHFSTAFDPDTNFDANFRPPVAALLDGAKTTNRRPPVVLDYHYLYRCHQAMKIVLGHWGLSFQPPSSYYLQCHCCCCCYDPYFGNCCCR
uniref:Uncharacterized protein n=1 Tax=Romanomermis culicivorax TaxID=13658 RepID=A0A915JZV1_ROMCU